jgi:hypothetical protein
MINFLKKEKLYLIIKLKIFNNQQAKLVILLENLTKMKQKKN